MNSIGFNNSQTFLLYGIQRVCENRSVLSGRLRYTLDEGEMLAACRMVVYCDQSLIPKIRQERLIDCGDVDVRLLNPCEQKK
jgi:hypothetical protein